MKTRIAFAWVPMFIVANLGSVSSAHASQLVLLSEPSPVVHFEELAPIQVKFLDRSGSPVSGAHVVFLPQSDTADTRLSNSTDLTDEHGIAETTIEGGTVEVDFDVLIGVRTGDDLVPPITVSVRVSPPDVGVLEARWPSEEFTSIQDAIYALADGGTLHIAEGEYEVPQPVFIRNKMVNIVGEGASCRELLQESGHNMSTKIKSQGTILVGPSVGEWVPPRESIGTLNFSNAGGSIKDIWFKRGKAGIVGRDIDGAAKPLDLSDLCISDTVRGIHWKADAPITVSDTVIADVQWNGISISPEQILSAWTHFITDTSIVNPKGACIYFENALGGVLDDNLIDCLNGGVVSSKSTIGVSDTNFIENHKGGLVLESSTAFLKDNVVFNTKPIISTNLLGDGVTAWANSNVVMLDNLIAYSARAAVSNFGSNVALGSNHLICQEFDLNGEVYAGSDFSFDDLGENLCGCPSATDTCAVVSASLEPPPPVGGLE